MITKLSGGGLKNFGMGEEGQELRGDNHSIGGDTMYHAEASFRHSINTWLSLDPCNAVCIRSKLQKKFFVLFKFGLFEITSSLYYHGDAIFCMTP